MTGTELCPDGKCHAFRRAFETEIREIIVGLKRTLYGPDGDTGLVRAVNSLVPKSWLWTFVVCIGFPVLIMATKTGYEVVFAKDTASLIYANAKESEEIHHQFDKRIGHTEKNVEINTKAIDKNTQAIKELKEEMSRKIDDQTNILLNAIKNNGTASPPPQPASPEPTE